MIKEFVDLFMEKKPLLREKLSRKHPENYQELVKKVVEILENDKDHYSISSERIHEIDDGCYQGTLVFVIGSKCYQPETYWYVKIYYGSCSGCDTLESICNYSSDAPTESEIDDYMTLCLHIVQKLKKMEEDIVE